MLNTMGDPLKSANLLLTRALDLEGKSRYSQALVLYQEGLQVFMDYLKIAPPAQKRAVRDKIEHFMNKAEAIKKRVEEQMKLSTYHEEIVIRDGETGHSYDSVFGHLLTNEVQVVKIEDPYIRQYHQFCNFVRLCELMVKKCPQLSKIILVTVLTDSQQGDFFQKMKGSIREKGVQFISKNNETLHDRQISLSSGWVVKLGRGLDYFKPPGQGNNLVLGAFDMDLRPCHQTNVDIYYTKDVVVD